MNYNTLVYLFGLCALLFLLRTMLEDVLKRHCIKCERRIKRHDSVAFYSGVIDTKGNMEKIYTCTGYCVRKMKEKFEEVQPSD